MNIAESTQEAKICFVQPNTDYQVLKNRSALAITFPQLIYDMGLSNSEYEIYVMGKSSIKYEEFIVNKKITHVFITSITACFPKAVEIAVLSKKHGCTTVLGGIFPSMNAQAIVNKYKCFDYVVVGKPDKNFISELNCSKNYPRIIKFPLTIKNNSELAPIMLQDKFFDIYNNNDVVCYEITNGCEFNCDFCTLRKAWGVTPLKCKSKEIFDRDINKLSSYWRKLKIIDDDFLQSTEYLQEVSFKNKFNQIIVESRVDRIDHKSIEFMKNFGVTHIILGVESFDNNFLLKTRKSNSLEWEKKAYNAIDLCIKNSIIPRPVIMVTTPHTGLNYLKDLSRKISEWKISNGIEVLFSFYTPHPMSGVFVNKGEFITNNLSKFDHLNLVYLPESFEKKHIQKIEELYRELVDITESIEYNPYLVISYQMIKQYDCFFK